MLSDNHCCNVLATPLTPPTHTPRAGIERSLLYTVSQVPIREFSAAALSVAVGCWQWLLTKRPDLEYPVSYVLGARITS